MDEGDTKCFRCRGIPTVVDVGQYEGCGFKGTKCFRCRGIPTVVNVGEYEGCEFRGYEVYG